MKNYSSFQEAIQDVVADFVEDGFKFSVHDVTNKIRNWVNNGSIVFDFLPLHLDATEVQPVLHPEVKNAFNDMLRNNLLPFLSIDYSNGYRLFYSEASDVVIPVKENIVIPAKKSMKVLGVEPLINKIERYVSNFYFNHQYPKTFPTVKQIQSTLRRDGNYTCQELLDLIHNEDTDLYYETNEGSKTVVSIDKKVLS